MSEDQAPERFEDVVNELEGLVRQLEQGQLPLDEALRLYERGVGLARKGNALLEGAERRIEELQRELAEPGR
ncbi:MAG: exodeoxyribonuclease VII small subunit [Myxococcales bacterium]|nr:exodeoxyribonuclease VII small subunit [Myxococcales bacterium]